MCNRVALIFVMLLCCIIECTAQSYPAKPVKIVVPWPAGGGTDTVARIVGQKLSEALGGAIADYAEIQMLLNKILVYLCIEFFNAFEFQRSAYVCHFIFSLS